MCNNDHPGCLLPLLRIAPFCSIVHRSPPNRAHIVIDALPLTAFHKPASGKASTAVGRIIVFDSFRNLHPFVDIASCIPVNIFTSQVRKSIITPSNPDDTSLGGSNLSRIEGFEKSFARTAPHKTSRQSDLSRRDHKGGLPVQTLFGLNSSRCCAIS
jgi:hypothetical protein